jgi:cysteine-rich repeat protein
VALLVASLPGCTGGGASTTTGFESGPATTQGPGPSSFGDSTSASSSGGSSGELPTTGTPDPTTTAPTSTSTDLTPTTTGTTDTTGSTGTPDTSDSSTGTPAGCGDGIVDADEFCDDGNQVDADACLSTCHPGTALLALVGVGMTPGVALGFDPELGWASAAAPIAILSADIEATPTGALAVIRRSSAVQSEHQELYSAAWVPGDVTPFATTTQVSPDSHTPDRPSLAAVADTVTLAYLGLDNKHFAALHTDNGWAAPVKLPAGQLDIQAFGPTAATVVPGTVETYAIYTGDDARIYYSMKSSPGGAWAASTATPPASVLGRPVGVVDPADDLVIAYVRKADGKLALIKLLTPQNAWSKEIVVHPQAITGGDISLARLDDGRYAVAWRGYDTEGIYLALAADFDQWAAPQEVDLPAATTTPPLLVPGTTGADLEILYTAGGKLRHVRVTADTVGDPADIPGISKATTVAAARVQLAP